MKKFLNKTTQLIFAQQGGMFSSAFILATMIVLSRLFGFLRYRILAGYFNKSQLDIFFASFRIPDLVFEILITGAFTSSFIPIFIRYQKNKKDLEENISSIFNLITIFLFFFILIIFFLLPFIIPLITPGFDSQKIEQIVLFSQMLLIGQLPFLVFGNFLTGIAQANKTFFITSIAPVIYNIVVIIITYFFANQFGLIAPIIGIIIGAFLFFLIQLPILINLRFDYLFIIKIGQGVKDFFRIVIPRILTVIFTQIDATVDLSLATLLGVGSYTIFYFAQHLQLLPVSVIGIAFGQASLPYLSELYEAKKMDEFKKIIIDSILNLLFLTIPIMGFFIFARTPLVRLFFGGQKFDWDATVNTAITLSYFSLSLPFHSIYYFITRCFYALHDSKTPFFISVFAIAVNTLFSLAFILYFHFPVWSLAISFSISVILNVLILLLILNKKLAGINLQSFIVETTKITSIAILSSVIAYLSIKLMDGLIFDTSRTINLFLLLTISGLIYLSLYLFLAWFINLKEFYLIGKLLLKMKQYQKKLEEVYSNHE